MCSWLRAWFTGLACQRSARVLTGLILGVYHFLLKIWYPYIYILYFVLTILASVCNPVPQESCGSALGRPKNWGLVQVKSAGLRYNILCSPPAPLFGGVAIPLAHRNWPRDHCPRPKLSFMNDNWIISTDLNNLRQYVILYGHSYSMLRPTYIWTCEQTYNIVMLCFLPSIWVS